MATNIALKRFKKAQRRKQQVAEKRRAEALEASLAARVLRAAQRPIQHCLVQEHLFDIGFGTLILARGATPYHVELGVFLIDVFCLGVKDVTFRPLEGEVFDQLMEAWDAASPLASVDPSYARKLLRDLAAWSRPLGLAPHRDFAVVERLFGDVNANASDAVFQFGRDGKPLYIPGPSESSVQIRHRIERLRNALGDDGFDLGTAA
jgi:hypothetical protein